MTKDDLCDWMYRLNRDLLECDPSKCSDALDWFIDIQTEQEELNEAIEKAGFTYDEIESLALC
tara:strand:- start:149 stop:337 length:189 start_codon:yes stop_codon:yes gene_type:complete